MATIEIALSADQENDLSRLDSVLAGMQLIVRHEDPLDLLLRERLSWFATKKAPDLIIASYRGPFSDLKIIADLKKVPAYQWVPCLVILNEDITHVKRKFIEYGVTATVQWNEVQATLNEPISDFIHEALHKPARK